MTFNQHISYWFYKSIGLVWWPFHRGFFRFPGDFSTHRQPTDQPSHWTLASSSKIPRPEDGGTVTGGTVSGGTVSVGTETASSCWKFTWCEWWRAPILQMGKALKTLQHMGLFNENLIKNLSIKWCLLLGNSLIHYDSLIVDSIKIVTMEICSEGW